MWNRREIKQKAKLDIKKHLLRTVAVCFIAAILGGGYSQTFRSVFPYDEEQVEIPDIKTTVLLEGKSNSEIIEEMLNGGQLRDISAQEKKYHRGVLAGLFNNVSKSDSFVFGLLNSFNEGFFHDRIGYAFILLGGTIISFLYWFFIGNIANICSARFFLETTIYKNTEINRLLFLARIRRIGKAARVMFWRWLYLFLWSLTIVGGFIKRYSYMMVPYIVAENPDLSRKEVFALSRRMMRGNKWKAFMMDFSFVPWYILGFITLSLVNIFHTVPYREAAKAELYMTLRKQMTERRAEGYQFFNDRYLTAPPVGADGQVADLVYPVDLFTIPEHYRRKWLNIESRRNYSLISLILLFFTFSMAGWLWEVGLHLITDGEFVNRGVLFGPWLPIYGSGGVLVLILLKKVRDKPILTFVLTVLVCGVLEYGVSMYLEITKGAKWWDYSGYLLNLHGRICAEGLLVFGIGGCAFIYILAPLLDNLYQKIPQQVKQKVCIVLLVVFMTDLGYSYFHPNMGKGITEI